MENNEQFKLTYSSKEQNEIRTIREKYLEKPKKEESALEKIKRLDASVSKKAEISSLTLGIIGTLLFGFGMSIVMTDFLSLSEVLKTVLGIAISAVSTVPIILAYPVYKSTLKRERKKIAPEILRLSDELIK